MADYSNPDTVSALATIDPELDAFMKSQALPAPDWENLTKLRDDRHKMELARAPSAEEAKLETRIKISMRDGYESEVIVSRPKNPPARSPLILLLFGGGFVVGSNLQLGPYARGLAKLYGATAVTLSYRLAPEHKHPAQPNDVWDSVNWLAANAASLGADPSAGFVLGGVSAGANLTAVTAQKALKEGLSPPLTGLWLSVPILLDDGIVPDKYKPLFFSREQNANAPVFNMSAIDRVTEYLQPNTKSPDWSPLNAADPHVGLPPSYIQVCGMDPLRDDGLIYEAILREHGVKTKLDVYPGVPHAHFSYLPQLQMSKKNIYETMVGFAWLLGTSPPSPQEVQGAIAPPSGG